MLLQVTRSRKSVNANKGAKRALNYFSRHKKGTYNLCKCLIIRGAANEARTHDPQLGKLMLYQLSYCRTCFLKTVAKVITYLK